MAQGGDRRQSLWQSKVKVAGVVCGGDGMRLRAPGGSPASLKSRWPGQSVPATARAPLCVRVLSASGGGTNVAQARARPLLSYFADKKAGSGRGGLATRAGRAWGRGGRREGVGAGWGCGGG